jgi:hypothetical protein
MSTKLGELLEPERQSAAKLEMGFFLLTKKKFQEGSETRE